MRKLRTPITLGLLCLFSLAATLLVAGPQAAVAKNLKLRLAHSESTTNIRHEVVLFFADQVKKLSDGSLTVEVFPAGVMGTHTQCQEMVSTGSLDFYITTAGLVSVFDSKRTQELIELPYLFDNYAQAYAFNDIEFVEKIYQPL